MKNIEDDPNVSMRNVHCPKCGGKIKLIRKDLTNVIIFYIYKCEKCGSEYYYDGWPGTETQFMDVKSNIWYPTEDDKK